MVSSKIYHTEGKSYGKTKRGKFLSEDDAKKAGYREANSETASKGKVKTADTKPKYHRSDWKSGFYYED